MSQFERFLEWASSDGQFWITATVGATVRVLMSEQRLSWKQGLATFSGAIFAAWVATKPLVHALHLDPEIYLIPVAALCTLVGEGVIRWIIRQSANDSFLRRIFARITGLDSGGPNDH